MDSSWLRSMRSGRGCPRRRYGYPVAPTSRSDQSRPPGTSRPAPVSRPRNRRRSPHRAADSSQSLEQDDRRGRRLLPDGLQGPIGLRGDECMKLHLAGPAGPWAFDNFRRGRGDIQDLFPELLEYWDHAPPVLLHGRVVHREQRHHIGWLRGFVVRFDHAAHVSSPIARSIRLEALVTDSDAEQADDGFIRDLDQDIHIRWRALVDGNVPANGRKGCLQYRVGHDADRSRMFAAAQPPTERS